jgi:pyruvate dehydrogenase E2 component (dihydrolipoamide acetyltransferase)
MDRKFSFTDLIIKAMCKVLEEYRNANDSLDGAYIIHNPEINMGVAVAIDGGLIVPVIKNANQLGLMDIHQKVGELARKAREHTLSPDELSGGTCTISNLGMYGCDHFTPIVNPPEAAILGVCRTVEKAVVIDHQIVIAPMMNAVLGYDHRIIDGATAGLVTSRLREYLENPLLLL